MAEEENKGLMESELESIAGIIDGAGNCARDHARDKLVVEAIKAKALIEIARQIQGGSCSIYLKLHEVMELLSADTEVQIRRNKSLL